MKLLVDPDALEAFSTDARRRYLWTGWRCAPDPRRAGRDRRWRSPGPAGNAPTAEPRRGDPEPAQRSLRVFIEEDR
ncbi:MAG: hypothetical protein M5U19_15020 [Microthrixaceae bacterium]|nr:hypothetical protein [Microthrixaceae bacterium]